MHQYEVFDTNQNVFKRYNQIYNLKNRKADRRLHDVIPDFDENKESLNEEYIPTLKCERNCKSALKKSKVKF